MNILRRPSIALAGLALIASVVVLSAPAAQSQAAPTEDRLVVYGADDDFITAGQDVYVSESEGELGVNALYGEGMFEFGLDIVGITADRTFWTIFFEPPPGEVFAAGETYRALAWGGGGPDAGFSFDGDSRGCGELEAEIEIYEFATSAAGDLETLSFDFRQRCEGFSEWAVGGLRYNSALPDPDPDFRLGEPPEPPAPTSTLTVYGVDGEYITQGEDLVLTNNEWRFVVGPQFGDVTNGIAAYLSRGATQWSLSLVGPDGEPLAAGDAFSDASRPFFNPGEPGLAFTGDGRGCNTISGQFEIYELTFSDPDTVEVFSADFRQSCDGGAEIVGGIRHNSTLAPPDPDFRVDDAPATCDGLTATIVGTEGDDTLIGTTGRDVIAGLGGDDVIRGLRGDDVICGGDGDDTINGDGGRDRLFGDAGHDTISGGAAPDEIDGGPGRDELNGGTGADVVRGSGGADVLRGGPGNDDLAGQGGPDQIFGSWGDDIIVGGFGDDRAVGGGGVDSCDAESTVLCE